MIYLTSFSWATNWLTHPPLPNQHSIATKSPASFTGPTVWELTPGQLVWDLKKGKITEEEYTDEYQDRLHSLLFDEDEKGRPIKFDFSQLEGKTLLCWEDPGHFCHRRILAQFLCKIGYEVWLDGQIFNSVNCNQIKLNLAG